mmetsp:Transcript_31352/g.27700  ORF Transcript_31352/g.27700 Transcript_31352/m.27700 type:complete len:98 (-) Transcript_31352:32-325(-)|eukprot:CAMPEP_0205818522 /NCGR_PEP_ID=MMETSP0206-20130828/449_1 /ASSEMBLY_ACC=CAM_ASM_000279 /TAXON_ID=36767 /ORGANISM="Euplotes focardii, Strain TN1" /LENGTH=97 /DNA_ID=CAMNT_0053110945 /DNA_START=17 /DNA_END=310 /DNA_ORIENTATION=-
MIFETFFKLLCEGNTRITVHMKNDLVIEGNIQNVDQHLNIQLDDIDVKDNEINPYLLSVKKLLVRGNTISHISIPGDTGIDLDPIQEYGLKQLERAN